jgi:ELWxxDGT repeat protein
MVVVEDRMFFVADNGLRGEELWRTNGSSGQTVLVKDIRPGASGSDI